MNVEAGITFNPNTDGVSLSELIPFAEKQYGGNGPRISPRIIWLSSEIEKPDFWRSLNAHITDDSKLRHSAGGLFAGPSGEKPLGPYTWSQVFTSLDRFLQGFDERAVEFLFRDYKPALGDRETNLAMESTRTLALDKYPRLRRIFWDDYRKSLESPLFWRSLSKDLERLTEPTSPTSFFYKEVQLNGNSEPRMLPTYLQSVSVIDSTRRRGVPGKKARFLSYPNLSQIIRDTFHQNPREFLLTYNPASQNEAFQQEVVTAKTLLTERILPPQPKPANIERITINTLAETIRTPEFWEKFVQDLDNHSNSPNQAYSLQYFLRTYDSQENNILANNAGDYTSLTTAFLTRRRKGVPLQRQLIKPSQELAELLMWRFQPSENIEELVLDAKRICSELFQQDCLYVALQTPDFWADFSQDLELVRGNPSFKAFLRFYNTHNPEADGRKHKKGTARYQRFLQRAYHKPKEFNKLCETIGVDTSEDYSEALNNFFYRFAPNDVRQLLEERFPTDFTQIGKEEKKQGEKQLQDLTRMIGDLMDNPSSLKTLECKNTQEVEAIRNKLATASRNLKVSLSTHLEGTTLTVQIAERRKFNREEIDYLEEVVLELRARGLQNKEIAQELGVEDHAIEYIAGKLIRNGQLESRRHS